MTATVRNVAARPEIEALGADVIDPEGFAEHGPFDVILELVGAPNLEQNLAALNILGRVAVIGISAGAKGEVNLGMLMGKRARIHGSTLRPRSLEDKAATARALERSVLPLLAAGAIVVPITATFPLGEAVAAYDRFTQGGKVGKIVLEM